MQNKITLLAGDNSYLRTKEKNEIIRSYKEDFKGRVSFYTLTVGSSEELKAKISQKIRGFSLFNEAELVVIKVEEIEKKISKSSKNLQRKNSLKSKGISFYHESFIASLALKVPFHITLLIDFNGKLEKKSVLIEVISKIEGAQIKNFDLVLRESASTLRSLIRDYLLRENIEINNSLIEELIARNKGDYWDTFSSLNQAALFLRATKNRQNKETDTDLVNLWNLQEEKKVFALLDAIGRKDQKNALSLLYKIISENTVKYGGETPAVLGLITLLRRQISQLIAVKDNISEQKAQKTWGIPPFAYSKTKFHSSLFNEKFLCQAFESLVNVQQKAKSGLFSPLPLLDFLVLRLISR